MAITSKLILEQSDTTHDSPVEPGKILVRTDEGAIYVDTDAGERVRVGDLVQADSLAAVIPQDGKIYKVDGVLYTLRDGELKPVSDPFPFGTILPYFGLREAYVNGNYDLADFTKMCHLEAPPGWRLCDGSLWMDCTADPGEGDSEYFGDAWHHTMDYYSLLLFSPDTTVFCGYYYFYPQMNSSGTYDYEVEEYFKPERIGYLKSGDDTEKSEYGLVYYDYLIQDLRVGSSGGVGIVRKLSSMDILDHTYESENSAKVSAIDETPFLILNGELYRLVSYNSDTIYRWKKDGGSTYRYTMKSETILNDTKPVCYTTTSLSTSDGTATECFMRPLYPLTSVGFYVMKGYLPNLSGLMPLGTDNANLTGAMLPATLPNITGTMNSPFGGGDSHAVNELLQGTGAITEDTATGTRYSTGSASTARRRLKFDASLSSPIYQDGATVRPPSFGVNWIIKV